MKIKQIIIAGTLLVSVASFAQKDELKALKKIYGKDEIKGNDLLDYKALVDKVQLLAVEEGDKIYANFYKCMIPVLEANALDRTMPPMQIQMQLVKLVSPQSISQLAAGLNATLDYEKKPGNKKLYTDDIVETITSFKPDMLNYAVNLGNQKKYKESADVLYAIYQLDKKDVENLYYAANYAIEGQDYDKALAYYRELKSINYTGEGTTYYAKNLASGREDSYNNKEDRDKLVTIGTHGSPREEKRPSKRGEIVKNIALILVQQGKTEEAKQAIAEAKQQNPNDESLKSVEVDMTYNLGVDADKANKTEEAEKFFNKALELDPNYVNAYLNLAAMKLRPDAKIVEEINKLGTSDKDLKKYEVLKVERQKIFKSALPLLEKAYQLKPEDEAVKSNLMTVYNFLEMTDKYKALKAK